MNKSLRVAVAAALVVASAAPSFALGTASYSSELISTRSLGQGGTGVAGVQDDAVAVYTNPAAMTAIKGTQVVGGLSYANASPKFTSGITSGGIGAGSSYTAANSGSVSGARATNALVPTFAATTQLLDGRLSVGLAAVTPYGLETHFDGDSPVRYQATDARLRLLDLTSAVAYKVSDAVSVGAGVDYYNAVDGALEKKINVTALNAKIGVPSAGADANSRLNGNGDGWGYHLGATIRPNEKNQIGIVYHSAVKVGLIGDAEIVGLSGISATVFGGANYRTNVTAPLFMPQNLQVGYAYTPNDKWQFELDAAWYDWYAARQLGVVYSGIPSAQAGVLNSGNPLQFNPRKTLNYGVGLNHKCTENLQTRVGAYYQASALADNLFDAAFIDLPRYAATIGLGYKVTDSFSTDFAYNAVFFHGRGIDAPGAAGSGSGYSGNFNNFANIVSASLTYRTGAHF